MTNRRIFVPGTILEVTTIMVDGAKNRILSIANGTEVIVVILAKSKVTAHLMSQAQARRFSDDVVRLHQAIADDAKIKQLEKEFSDGEE